MEILQKYPRRQPLIFLSLLFLVAILLIVIAIIIQSPYERFSLPFQVVGSSFFGVSLALLFGYIFNISDVIEIKALLQNALQSSLTSTEKDLTAFRIKWHRYHLTYDENNTPIWRYGLLEFHLAQVPGKLTCTTRVQSPDGHKTLIYKVEGFLAKTRLILVFTPEGDEPINIAVFPFVGQKFEYKHAGVSILQTYGHNRSNSDILAPVIISETPLVDEVISPGTLSESMAEKVSQEWLNAFKLTCKLPLSQLCFAKKANKS